MWVLQWMLKNQLLFTRLICEYCNGSKKPSNYLWDLYVGIAMDVKIQRLFMKPICIYCIFEIMEVRIKRM
jgi:hypothetical protein